MTDTPAAAPLGAVPALTVETREVEHFSSLLPLLDAQRPLLFLRRGEGVIGLGETFRLEFQGPNRVHEAAETWRRIAGAARVDDQVNRSGTGLLGFGAFAFDDESQQPSVLIVPEVIVGRRDGVSWVTRINGSTRSVLSSPLGPEYRLSLASGCARRRRLPRGGRRMPWAASAPATFARWCSRATWSDTCPRAPTCAACSWTSRSATRTPGPTRSTVSSARAPRPSCASPTAR